MHRGINFMYLKFYIMFELSNIDAMYNIEVQGEHSITLKYCGWDIQGVEVSILRWSV